ncbi:UvrD-helicase domain-containing protein [Oerskovia enterophila]|uniref:UvrD-helicase domain-containing protein n=1 Tax=Oerskovia enterophila TaxID=43678 RepID=UPI003823468F
MRLFEGVQMLKSPTFDAVLSDEQAYFDEVYELRESKRQARLGGFGAAADVKARARLRANAEKDDTLGKPSDAAAFLRIDTGQGDHYYVGNGLVRAEGECYVYSWKAPSISEMRDATFDDPRGVVRLRRFSCVATNTIETIDDTVLEELASRVAALDDPELAVIEADAMLQDVLDSSREPEMRHIVETIQAAQSALIGSDPDRTLVIQGGPGTGKTAVALHRLSVILYRNESIGPEDVMVVGPNMTFARYISRIMPELGDDSVLVTDLVGMLDSSMVPSTKETAEVARLKGDLRMVDVVARALADRVRPPLEDSLFTVAGAPWRLPVSPDIVRQLVGTQKGQPYALGRTGFREALKNFVANRAAQRLRDDGIARRGDVAMRLDGSEIDSVVSKVWPSQSPHAFLRGLFGSVQRLLTAAGGELLADEVTLLQRSTGSRVADQAWSKEDLCLLDEVAAQMGEAPRRYAHIVIDEAQDLSPMQVRAINRRSRGGALTFVGDIAQSTGHWARDGWEDLLDQVKTSLPKQIEQLALGYRVPRSVMDLAACLLPEAAPGLTAPRVVRDVEPGPVFTEVAEEDDLPTRVVEVVSEHSRLGRFVGVICPDSARADMEESFKAHGISWQDADKGGLGAAINLVSPVASKGLEFDAVVVVDPQQIIDAGPEGLRMLYVALTRTTKFLDLVYAAGRLPRQLGGEGGVRSAQSATGTSSEGSPRRSSSGEQETREDGSALTRSGGQSVTSMPRWSSSPEKAHDLTARQRLAVEREAREVLERLEETVAPSLVRAILGRAIEMLDVDAPNRVPS